MALKVYLRAKFVSGQFFNQNFAGFDDVLASCCCYLLHQEKQMVRVEDSKDCLQATKPKVVKFL